MHVPVKVYIYLYLNVQGLYLWLLWTGFPVIAPSDGTPRPQRGDRCPGDIPTVPQTPLTPTGLPADHPQEHPPLLHL